jgi:hypothetical protein
MLSSPLQVWSLFATLYNMHFGPKMMLEEVWGVGRALSVEV